MKRPLLKPVVVALALAFGLSNAHAYFLYNNEHRADDSTRTDLLGKGNGPQPPTGSGSGIGQFVVHFIWSPGRQVKVHAPFCMIEAGQVGLSPQQSYADGTFMWYSAPAGSGGTMACYFNSPASSPNNGITITANDLDLSGNNNYGSFQSGTIATYSCTTADPNSPTVQAGYSYPYVFNPLGNYTYTWSRNTGLHVDPVTGAITSYNGATTYQMNYGGCWSNPVCCFPAGSRVLMADGTERRIETLREGDVLMGADGQAYTMTAESFYRTRLGSRALLAMADGSLLWSEEHAFWTRDGAGEQWWWSANPEMWRDEAAAGGIGGLLDNSTLRGGSDVEFATLKGWERKEVVVAEDFGPQTELFLPRTFGVPIIVNGYVVGASVNERNYDYTAFDWSPKRVSDALARAGRELLALAA